MKYRRIALIASSIFALSIATTVIFKQNEYGMPSPFAIGGSNVAKRETIGIIDPAYFCVIDSKDEAEAAAVKDRIICEAKSAGYRPGSYALLLWGLRPPPVWWNASFAASSTEAWYNTEKDPGYIIVTQNGKKVFYVLQRT